MFRFIARRIRPWAIAATVATCTNGSLSGQSTSTGFVATTKNGEWQSYTGDTRGSRYSPLDQINAQNFNDLEVAWRFKTDSLGTRPEYKLEGTPLMIGGVLYATAGTRRSVIALDAATGERKWEIPYADAGWAGVTATAGGVVFSADHDGTFIVADSTTGKKLYEYQTGAAIFAPPTTYLLDGRQYVVMPSGSVLTAFALPKTSSGTR